MPFNGSGVYSAPASPGAFNPAVSGGSADPTSWNTLLTDLTANGLSLVVCADGQSTITADIPLNSHKITGLANGTLAQDAATVSQVQGVAQAYAADTGAANLYVITPSPAVTAYAVGQLFRWKVAHVNTTTTPTLAVSGLTAGIIAWANGDALAASDLPANAIVETVVDTVTTGTPTFQLLSVTHFTATQTQANNSTKAASTAYVDRVGVQQVVTSITGAVATGTTTTPWDDTIPQNSEGTEFMTLAITPKSATSKLIIQVVFNYACNVGTVITMALFQDSTANALAATACLPDGSLTDFGEQIILNYEMVSGTTSATTFRIRAGGNGASTITFNGSGGARKLGGVMASSIIITEIGI